MHVNGSNSNINNNSGKGLGVNNGNARGPGVAKANANAHGNPSSNSTNAQGDSVELSNNANVNSTGANNVNDTQTNPNLNQTASTQSTPSNSTTSDAAAFLNADVSDHFSANELRVNLRRQTEAREGDFVSTGIDEGMLERLAKMADEREGASSAPVTENNMVPEQEHSAQQIAFQDLAKNVYKEGGTQLHQTGNVLDGARRLLKGELMDSAKLLSSVTSSDLTKTSTLSQESVSSVQEAALVSSTALTPDFEVASDRNGVLDLF